jgi:hypothetical protein
MEQVSLVHGIEEAQVSLVHSIEDGTEKCPLMICTSIIKRPLCVEVAELREPHAHTKTARSSLATHFFGGSVSSVCARRHTHEYMHAQRHTHTCTTHAQTDARHTHKRTTHAQTDANSLFA